MDRAFKRRSRTRILLAITGAASVIAVSAAAWPAQQPPPPAATVRRVSQDDQKYMCPMHPDVISDVPGVCPRCRMTFVLGRPYDMRDYRVTMAATPAVVTAGVKTTLRFEVFAPGTGEKVKAFTEVHLKRYHLFVVSQDMSVFEHVHPEQDDNGTWTIDVTLPKPGYYKLLSDFVPFGGSPQFIATPLITAGFQGDLVEDAATLLPDVSLSKTVDDLTATVSYDPPQIKPALHSHLTFRLSHAGTTAPVTDLQTYLGAFGHILIVSENLEHFVHSHPIDMPPQDKDVEGLLGGPQVIFEALMPAPGRYRAWVQFRYHDKVHTFPFTFEVAR
jgi:hypothetical protein